MKIKILRRFEEIAIRNNQIKITTDKHIEIIKAHFKEYLKSVNPKCDIKMFSQKQLYEEYKESKEELLNKLNNGKE